MHKIFSLVLRVVIFFNKYILYENNITYDDGVLGSISDYIKYNTNAGPISAFRILWILLDQNIYKCIKIIFYFYLILVIDHLNINIEILYPPKIINKKTAFKAKFSTNIHLKY